MTSPRPNSMFEKFYSLALFALFLCTSVMAGTTNADDPYRWYTDENELLKAVETTGRPVFFFFGKDNCAICDLIWDDYLRADQLDTKTQKGFLTYMKENKILGLHLKSSKTYSNVVKMLKKYFGSGYEDEIFGKNTYFSPILAFGKVNPDTSATSADDISFYDRIYGSCGVASASLKNYNNVTKWVNNMMTTDQFKADFPDSVTLTFSETIGTTSDGECFDTASAVQSENVKFAKGSKETSKYIFKAEKGKRYIFSGKDLPTDASPKLTCEISGSALSKSIKKVSASGFEALDKGIFFEPSADGDYTLTLSLDTAPTADISFELHYHCMKYSETIGSFAMPMWSGTENGKWALYDENSIKRMENDSCFLLCFGGYAWCPHCVALDKLLFETEAFEKAVKDYPLIYVDNRRRGEETGPSLLYGDSYQAYLTKSAEDGGAGIAAKDLDAVIEAKLAANKELQNEYQLDKDLLSDYNLSEDRIRYPSLFLCKKTSNGKFSVILRVSPWYPSYSEDVEDFAQNFMEKILDMKDDVAEENDNWAGKTEQTVTLKKEQVEATGAKIGGFDLVDWRTLDCRQNQDWEISIYKAEDTKDYDDDATISLKLFIANGHDTSEGTCLQSAYGTWDEPPVLELRGNAAPFSRRLKINIEDEQEDAVVPYTVAYKPVDLPPFDIQFASDEYYVTGDDANFELPVLWTKMEESSEAGKFKLKLNQGSTADYFEFDGTEKSGTVQCSIINLKKDLEEQPYSQDFQAALENVSNCRIKGNATAMLRVFTLPAFVDYSEDDYDDGNIPTLPIILVHNHDMEQVTLDFRSGSDTQVAFTTTGNLPKGISAVLNDANNAIIISGKPGKASEAGASMSATITLQDSVSKKNGASLKLNFIILSSEDYNAILALYNEVAASTADYTGRILSDDGEILGMLEIHRDSEKAQLSVDISSRPYETQTAMTLPDWSISYSGEYVYSLAENDDATLYLGVEDTGYGYGYLYLKDASFEVQFTPNLTEASQDDYLGTYNVSLESSHKDFRGFGYLVLEVKEDGSANYKGELPDGKKISGETNVVVEDGQGIVTIYAKVDDGSTIAGCLSIINAKQRIEGEACICACDDGSSLAWRRHDETTKTTLSPCGTAFDQTKPISTLLKDYTSLNFFAFENYYNNLVDWKSSAWYIHAAILHHIPLKLPESTAGQCSIDNGNLLTENLKDTLKMFPELNNLAVSVTADGMFNGSFKSIAGNIEFSGIFVPISASCCSTSPDFIASGKVLEKDDKNKVVASYPVWIIPQEGQDEGYENWLKKLEMPTITAPNANGSDKYTLKGSSENETAVYVLLDKDENITNLSANGKFTVDFAEKTKFSVTAAKAGCMLSAKPTQCAKTDTWTLSLKPNITSGQQDAQAQALALGWWALAFPKDTLLVNSKDLPQTYILDENTKVMQKSPMPSDKPFFLYNNGGYSLNVVQITQTEQDEGTRANGRSEKFQFTAKPETPEKYEIYYWDNEKGVYIYNDNDNDIDNDNADETYEPPEIDNLMHGVWCKKTNSTQQ